MKLVLLSLFTICSTQVHAKQFKIVNNKVICQTSDEYQLTNEQRECIRHSGMGSLDSTHPAWSNVYNSAHNVQSSEIQEKAIGLSCGVSRTVLHCIPDDAKDPSDIECFIAGDRSHIILDSIAGKVENCPSAPLMM